MKIEEQNALLVEIAESLADQPKVTTLLSRLREDYTQVSATLEKAQSDAETNKKNYEDALKYNMQLFKERAVQAPPQQTNVTQSEDKKSFSDLDLKDF